MQRLAGVIFAQGLWGIRLSHVEDLPIAIAPAYDKPTAAFNDFLLLYYTLAYFMLLFPHPEFKHTMFFFFISIIGLCMKICRHRSVFSSELINKH